MAMLFLVFELEQNRYALDVRQIAEVLPLVDVKHIAGAPPAIAGLFTHRGALVPVIDLSELALGRPAARRLSTRLVLVHYPDPSGQTHLLGLITERATQTVRCDASAFVASGVTNAGAAYLGPVAIDTHGLLQQIDLSTLLPPSLHDMLFQKPMGNRWDLPTSQIS